MQTITVNKLSLQFDDYSDKKNSLPRGAIAQNIIDKINDCLKNNFADECPTIMSIQVSPEHLYVSELTEELPEEKIVKTVEILQHKVKWWFRDNGSVTELPESAEQHIEQMIIDGYRCGTLNYRDSESDTDISGWWEIIS